MELEEPNYDLKKINFSVDGVLSPKIKEPFPNTSFFWVIVGKSGSGKTSLLINALTNKSIYKKVFSKISLVMPSSSLSSMKDNIFENIPENQIFHKLDYDVVERIEQNQKEFLKLEKSKYQLLIMDDITSSLKENYDILVQLATNRRHLKLSIILLVQFSTSIPRQVRFQITDITIFNPSNEIERQTIKEEFIPLSTREFNKLARFVWRDRHDFLFVNKNTNSYFKNMQKIKGI